MIATLSGSAPARQRLAVVALLTATFTGAATAAFGQTGWHLYGATGYIVIAIIALAAPAWITAQVIAGQLLLGSILLAPNRPSLLLILPVLASVIVTAELLALIARFEPDPARNLRADLRAVLRSAAGGAAIFLVVMLAGSVPGPSGMWAVVLASAACTGLALLLVHPLNPLHISASTDR